MNVLTFKDSVNYTESSIILSEKKSTDNNFTLYQAVSYNAPGIVDEEFSYTLKMIFPDPEIIKTKKALNLATDTSIIKSSYGVFSVWNWGDEKCKISGQIEIIEWSKNSVTIKENISIIDQRRNEIITFIGTRTFKRKKGW